MTNRTMLCTCAGLAGLSLLLQCLPAGGARPGPTQRIREASDRIIKVVKSKELSSMEKREQIRAVADSIFSWTEIARRSLGLHYRDLDKEQIKEFTDMFAKLMEASYVKKLEAHYVDLDRIDYRDEQVKGKYARVRTTIYTKKDTQHPVEYRMKMKPDGWRIYDVVIEGVSMVKNYRGQFKDVIKRSGFKGLIDTLKKNIEKEEKDYMVGPKKEG